MANNSVATATAPAPLDATVVPFELRKAAGRALDDAVILAHAHDLSQVVNAKSGEWVVKYQSHREYKNESGSGLYYAMFFTLTGPTTSNVEITIQAWLSEIASKGAKIKGNPWLIHSVRGEAYVPMTAEEKVAQLEQLDSAMVPYADVKFPENPMSYFKVKGHELFGVDPAIRNILRVCKSAIDSDFQVRSHRVIVGPPGCGKTSLLKVLEMMFGKKAVLLLDGTSMTSAGVQKLFMEELPVLPRFVIIEEIEKADPSAVQFLLGMMDDRGELRKNTARRNVATEAKVIVFATANDWDKLSTMQAGAVASRFGDMQAVVYMDAPTPEMMRRILQQAVENYPGGKMEWIKPTIAWLSKVGSTNPRYAKSVLTTGRDDLLDGTYQADMEATMLPQSKVVNLTGK